MNLALRACAMAIFGEELASRAEAGRKAALRSVAGEDGGSHSRGNEVIVELAGRWTEVRCSNNLAARRSIVLDSEDPKHE